MKKTILITGATGGVAQKLAEQLIQQNVQLVLVSRDAEKLKQQYGDAHIQIVADCSDMQSVQALFEELNTRQLQVSALAHCVGNIRLGAMHRMSQQDFQDCLHANLLSAYFTLAGFIQHVKHHQQAGAAVFVSSAAARIGTPNHEAIALAKGGLEAMVRSAAATYASQSIRVNAVAPGIMDTAAAKELIASELTRELAAKQYPIKGIGDPAEVASLMAWLLSDAAARVTGQIWSIDGGFSAIRPLVK